MVSTVMEIIRVTKTLDPVGVSARLSNMSGIADLFGGVREIAPTPSVTWGSASDVQQSTLAFIGDASGNVSTGTPNPTILW